MCRMFITQLVSLIEMINLSITEFTKLGDQDSCLSLRYSTIVLLTTLAELYYVLARNCVDTVSSSSEFQNKYNDALSDVVAMAGPLSAEDFRLADPFLGVSFALT